MALKTEPLHNKTTESQNGLSWEGPGRSSISNPSGRRNSHHVSDLRFCLCSSLMARHGGDDNEEEMSLLSYFIAPTRAEQGSLPPSSPSLSTHRAWPCSWSLSHPSDTEISPCRCLLGLVWVRFSVTPHSPNPERAAGSLWGGAEGKEWGQGLLGTMGGQSQANRTSSCSTQGGTERGQPLGR